LGGQLANSVELKVGDRAPDFTLPAVITKPEVARIEVSLNDYVGRKNTVIAFYAFAFTAT
jgi:peroxiredoxin